MDMTQNSLESLPDWVAMVVRLKWKIERSRKEVPDDDIILYVYYQFIFFEIKDQKNDL